MDLATAALQGAPAVWQDIDFWFDNLQRLKVAPKSVGGTVNAPGFVALSSLAADPDSQALEVSVQAGLPG
ncbi:MAG: hypothetical protein ACE5HD_03510 [Acidobacteriota bacterium]